MDNKKKTVMVKAAEGRRMALPVGHAINYPGNYITSETPVEMIWSSFVRRRLRAGDFVMSEGNEEPKKESNKVKIPSFPVSDKKDKGVSDDS